MSDNGERKVITTMITIGIDEDNRVYIKGDLKDKKKCIAVLAEAIKAVNGVEQSPIIRPGMDFNN